VDISVRAKTTIAKLNILHDKRDQGKSSRANINIRPGGWRQNRFRRIAEEKKRRIASPPLSVGVMTTAERKDNCINLFPIRHRNSRSFGLITLLKDSAATPYHPAGLRLPIKFLEEQNARPPAVHRCFLTLLNRDLYESRFVLVGNSYADGDWYSRIF